MKRFIQNFCEGFYDGIKNKDEISYQQVEDVFMKLIPSMIQKIIMVIIALLVSIPFLWKFQFQNKFNLWILELLLWIVWIHNTLDLEPFKKLMKSIRK
ncbi:hypothetical protein [Floccifex sp.]|uniref:hypothetical protein n=1 Tax=Floccifex sp. TaxID=2815810 RepID=UPI003F0304BC